ncbi:peptidase [Pantoea agglomerans]|uniref:peptidase n=1 Tax=Enterobacter agglomerans TaxID=549 RepID=UPI0016548579|nr:peptidase [Pantoea agglomerans]
MAFQSPAANFTEQRLDFTSLVNLSSHSSYVFKSASDYPDIGILKGSLLAVDRAIPFKHDQIVIANVGEDLVLRRLLLTPIAALQELDGPKKITPMLSNQDVPVWGVIAYVLTDMAGSGFNFNEEA